LSGGDSWPPCPPCAGAFPLDEHLGLLDDEPAEPRLGDDAERLLRAVAEPGGGVRMFRGDPHASVAAAKPMSTWPFALRCTSRMMSGFNCSSSVSDGFDL